MKDDFDKKKRKRNDSKESGKDREFGERLPDGSHSQLTILAVRLGYTLVRTVVSSLMFYLALIIYMMVSFGEIRFDWFVSIFYAYLIAFGIATYLDSEKIIDDIDNYL